MKRILIGILLLVTAAGQAQTRCLTKEYLQQQLTADPGLAARMSELERFNSQGASRTGAIPLVIKIPVVFHVLYHQRHENLTDQKILEQLETINRDFRRSNPDTINTPSYFRAIAADMQMEFVLARSDPQGRSTTGIVRKYTAVDSWMTDDKMKYDSEYGSDAWDSHSYLNIWICNLRDAMGYSAFPGTDADKDGVVLDYRIVGNGGPHSGYNMGRTAVHEVGHWLNLKHIWGDAFCGSDDVDDTPTQMIYTPGCPSGIRSTCNNGTNGDMYMNYMDFTSDACMNMFTLGQRQRARALFQPGGARHSILSSKAFDDPTVQQGPLPDFYPKWLEARVYPNPAQSQVNIYFEYDDRWLGKELQVVDVNGITVIRRKITARVQTLDISRLPHGVYFIRAEKNGERIFKKFVKAG